VRLIARLGDSQTRVDLSADARMLEPTDTEFGVALSVEELAVDKVLAIFGRAEARDFIDLVALQPHFGLPHLFRLAKQKDLGFDENVFRQMLDRFDRLTRDEFDVDDETYIRVKATVDQWKTQTP
jgi:predicted nucleotidyltransferase component of viral defense system